MLDKETRARVLDDARGLLDPEEIQVDPDADIEPVGYVTEIDGYWVTVRVWVEAT